MEHGPDGAHRWQVSLPRTTAHTIMADDTIAYQHEVPNAYPTDVPLPWAETFDLNHNSGAKLTTSVKAVDSRHRRGSDEFALFGFLSGPSRSTGKPELQTVPQQVRGDGYVDFRVTARDLRLRIEVGAHPASRGPAWTQVLV